VRFVLDASVALSWLLVDGKASDRRYARAVLEAMKAPDAVAEVPVTWGLEVANVLAKGEAKGVITEAQSEAFLEMLGGIRVHADTATFSRSLTDVLQLARRYRLSSYDASYLELALRAGLPLATLDADLKKVAKKAGTRRFDPL
jgi:predicted nucleic acid-binding protein